MAILGETDDDSLLVIGATTEATTVSSSKSNSSFRLRADTAEGASLELKKQGEEKIKIAAEAGRRSLVMLDEDGDSAIVISDAPEATTIKTSKSNSSFKLQTGADGSSLIFVDSTGDTAVSINNAGATFTSINVPGGPSWSTSGNALDGSQPYLPDEWIGSINDMDWVVKTNNLEWMRVKAGIKPGWVSMGTFVPSTGPDAQLHVRHSASAGDVRNVVENTENDGRAYFSARDGGNSTHIMATGPNWAVHPLLTYSKPYVSIFAGSGNSNEYVNLGTTGAANTGYHAWHVGASTGTTEVMRLNDDGDLGIGTTTPTHPLHMASGAHVTAGGTWTNASDVNLKENMRPVDGSDMLDKVAKLPITQWNYRNEAPSITHIGPTAQDFLATFGVGGDDKSISTIDPSGIALAAIQALNQKLNDQKMENDELRAQIAELREMIRAQAAQPK